MMKKVMGALVILLALSGCIAPEIEGVVSPFAQLESDLEFYNFNLPYQEGVFDCSDMSIATCKKLCELGYDAVVVYGDGHAWVYLYDEGVAIECTGNQVGIGRVVHDEEYYGTHFTCQWDHCHLVIK